MHGDLGNDTGTVALNMIAKAGEALLEAIRALIKGLYQVYKDSPQMKLDLIKLKEAKSMEEKMDILKKMNGVDGYIKAKQLEKYCDAVGARVIPRNMEFATIEQREIFFKVAKEQHLLYSMTQEKDNPLKTTILVADRDMELLERCKELTDDTLKMEAIDKKIESILSGREYNDLTEAEKFKVDLLNAEKATISSKWTNVFNVDSYDKILSNVLLSSHGGKNYEAEKLAFDYETFTHDTYRKSDAFASALDADVTKTLNKDRHSVIVSANDPNKFIICHSENNPDKKAYKKIVTTYEVFNGKQTADGENESRVFSDANLTAKEWVGVRGEMRNFGGFNNENVLRFNSVNDFDNWRKFTKEQNEIEEVRVFNDKELTEAIHKRTEELKQKGFEVRTDGEVYSIADNKKARDIVVELDDAIKRNHGKNTDELTKLNYQGEKAKMTEGVLIGLELATYEALSKVNNDLATLKTNLTIAEINGDKEKSAGIENEISELTQKHDALTNDKEKIVGQRKEINSVQVDLDIKIKEKSYQFTKSDNKALVQLSKSFEKCGFGTAKEFMDKMNNMDFKEATVYLAKLSVDIGNVMTEQNSYGGDISDFSDLRTQTAMLQNEFLDRVKKTEPDIFPYMMNYELDGKSLKIAEKLGAEYEKMGLGDKEEFVNSIKNAHGNERISTIETYKREVQEKSAEKSENGVNLEKNTDLIKEFETLSRLEFAKNRESRETIANVGDISDDRSSNGKTVEDWENDIKDRKENNPIGNEQKKGTREKEATKNEKSDR